MKNILNFIPWVLIGKIIGVCVFIPLGYYIYDICVYENKYNEEAELYYSDYIKDAKDIIFIMPDYNSKSYLDNIDDKAKTIETFPRSIKENAFSSPTGYYIPFYSVKYNKYFSIMYFNYVTIYGFFNKQVHLTVNKDDMQNPKYGTKENPIPVLKMVGVNESIRDNNRDFDTLYMNEFYKNNVIRYLKYKMSKKEFNQRFKNNK